METILRPPALSAERLHHALVMLPRYWDLFVVLTMHRIQVRYKQSLLGPIWAVLQPLAMMTILATVFSLLMRVPSDGAPYAVFAYAGLLPWTAFATALGSASASLVSHAPLVTRVYFPREILPLTYVAAALFDLLIASVVLAAMLVYYQIALSPAALWLVPIVALLAAVSLALSLVLSAVNVRYRDITVAMPVLLQVWMFASPVIYPLSLVPEAWRPWYALNPMVGIVDSFRRAVLEGRGPDPVVLGIAAALTVCLLPVAYVWFKHVDATMADML